jgi:hypothetical protein
VKFNQVTGLAEGFDIFGNPLTAEAPTPAVPEVIEVPEPVAEVKKLSWSPYTDLSIYNPALLPAAVQKTIKAGGDFVFKNPSGDSAFEMGKLGLNPKSRKDCQVYADFMSIFIPGDDLYVRRFLYDAKSNPIKLDNDAFSTDKKLTPDGTGFAMVARQLAAAQEIAKRTGKDVEIKTHAINYADGSYTGFSVWPKLGYNFPVPAFIQAQLKEMGFADKDTKQTVDLMTAKNKKGQTGFDVWRELTENRKLDGYGTTTVSASGTLSPAQKVTQEYGRRKGFVKSQQQPSDIFSGGQLSADDDNALRQAWMSIGSK